jgi:hypothetical protein
MANIERHEVTIQTAADGTGTGYTGVCNGFVQAIRYLKGDYADGVDFTVTAEKSGATIWDQDNVNASVTIHPRAATSDTAGAASLYAAAGEPVEAPIPVSKERIKIEIAQGGDTKSGTFHVYVGG